LGDGSTRTFEYARDTPSSRSLCCLGYLLKTGVRTGILSGSQEHFLAYMISGLLMAAAVPRYRFVQVAYFYVLLAAVLELGQSFAPGRDAEAHTAFVSMSGRWSARSLRVSSLACGARSMVSPRH
jgi:hypothetical protein